MKAHGRGVMLTVFSESLFAGFIVAVFIYLLTGNLALSLILGALAPASAPAGTIAVIDETKSKGKLTNTLYSVVGIDDATAIIIFGIMSPVAVFLLSYSGNDIAINKSLIGFSQQLRQPAWFLRLLVQLRQNMHCENQEKRMNSRQHHKATK